MTKHAADSLHFVLLKFISYLNIAALHKHSYIQQGSNITK